MRPELAPSSLAEWQRSVAAVCEGRDNSLIALQGQILLERGWAIGLEVYRNNYLGARLGTLMQTFPRLLTLLGKNYLQQCGRRFLSRFPHDASPGDLNHLGLLFSSFLRNLLAEKEELTPYPWLADLANLEYARHAAYYATDDKAFDFEEFQKQGNLSEGAVFVVSNSLALIDSQWPLQQIDADIAAGKILEKYPTKPQILCVFRENFSVKNTLITQAELALFKGINEGLPMATLLEQSEENASLLPLFIQRAWISGFKHKLSSRNV